MHFSYFPCVLLASPIRSSFNIITLKVQVYLIVCNLRLGSLFFKWLLNSLLRRIFSVNCTSLHYIIGYKMFTLVAVIWTLRRKFRVDCKYTLLSLLMFYLAFHERSGIFSFHFCPFHFNLLFITIIKHNSKQNYWCSMLYYNPH
jgi:hypothetical protein